MRACLVAVGSLFALGLGLMLSMPHVAAQKAAEKDKHDPANAVDNLEVHKDLKATLFASEPMITNPTNIDIDARGRVWVCDVRQLSRQQRQTPRRRPHPHPRRHRRRRQGRQGHHLLPGPRHRLRHRALRPRQQGHRLLLAQHLGLHLRRDATTRSSRRKPSSPRPASPSTITRRTASSSGRTASYYWNFGNTGGSVSDKAGKQVLDIEGNAGQLRPQSLHGRHGLPLRSGRQQLRSPRLQLPQQL